MSRRNSGARLRYLEKRKCFYIVWTEAGRSRERSTGTTDRKLAEKQLADFIHVRTRDSGPRDPAEILVTDILADYAQEHGPDTASPWRIAAAVKVLVPYWQGKTVAKITRETCKAYGMERGRADGTVRRELGILRAAVNYAHRAGRLSRMITVDLPESGDPRDRWLTRKEAAALLRASLREPRVRLHMPLFILLGLYTGQRKSAVLSLRWSQVSLEAGRIDFNTPGARKSKKRKARQAIPRKLLHQLKCARERGTDVGFVINEHGNKLNEIKRGFASACTRAGLGEDVTPHVLRHTCATWLMQAGVPIWEASGYLAMSPETLMRVYGHHHPDYNKDVMRAFA